MAKANKKQALGRGLSALLKEVNTPQNPPRTTGDGVLEIPISEIVANPFQPRTTFDEDTIKELAQSIKELGLIQPITVTKIAENKYQLVSGERRFRAVKSIGKKAIIAYVIGEKNDQEKLEMALVENIQRTDLDPIEIALSYQRLIDEVELTQETLAKRVGKKRATVTNYLRLLKLNPIIQMGMRDNFISMGHGRALINVPDEAVQLKIYERVLEQQLSVRATEELVRALKNDTTATKKPTATTHKKAPDFVGETALKNMKSFLGRTVKINVNAKGKGKIIIPFDGSDDFKEIQKKLS